MRKITLLLLALFITTAMSAADETGRRRPKSNGDQTLSMGKKQKKANAKIKKSGFRKKKRR